MHERFLVATMKILIFPSCLAASIEFLKEARRWNCFVIGSSSLQLDPFASVYDQWVWLPDINDTLFGEKFLQLIESENITRIFTPHASTYRLLTTDLKPYLKHIDVHGDGPFQSEMDNVNNVLELASGAMEELENYVPGSPALNQIFLASLLSRMEEIHGECSSYSGC